MAPERKGGARMIAAAGTGDSRAVRPVASAQTKSPAKPSSKSTLKSGAPRAIAAVAATSGKLPGRETPASIATDRDRLRKELKQAHARLARLEARESVVQDHLTKAIATIDRLLGA